MEFFVENQLSPVNEIKNLNNKYEEELKFEEDFDMGSNNIDLSKLIVYEKKNNSNIFFLLNSMIFSKTESFNHNYGLKS